MATHLRIRFQACQLTRGIIRSIRQAGVKRQFSNELTHAPVICSCQRTWLHWRQFFWQTPHSDSIKSLNFCDENRAEREAPGGSEQVNNQKASCAMSRGQTNGSNSSGDWRKQRGTSCCQPREFRKRDPQTPVFEAAEAWSAALRG